MNDPLPPQGKTAAYHVGVNIAGQQGHLEEDHAGDPEGCGPAEPWQYHLGDHRLHLKQQHTRKENRYSV